MTLTRWSHAPTEDPKRPTKTPSNRRKLTKEEKTLFKGRVKKCLRKAGEVFYNTYKVFLSGKKDLKQCKRLKER